MFSRLPVALLVLGCLLGMGQGASGEDRWARAEREVVRLPPAAFPSLPTPIAQYLERLGCTIPQSFVVKEPHNVIRGRFRTPGQGDWAVLCSRNRVSSILVFWEGAPTLVAELAAEPDGRKLQVIDGQGTIGYSRLISPVSTDYIRRRYKAYGGSAPAFLEHDGIDNAFVEKASVVYYWHQGRWLELAGAD